MTNPLQFPDDMPESVRRVIGEPTADAIRAWRETQGHSEPAPTIEEWVFWLERIADKLDEEARAEDRTRAHGARSAAGRTGNGTREGGR